MKSIISVPLVTSGKVIGMIYLDNRQLKGLFTKESFELLKAFAVVSAISIQNTKLYAQLQTKAKIEQEMDIAKDIQMSILPEVANMRSYEIAAFMRTADEVGGDYYDFFIDEEPYFCLFGDVSGHGLKSGLIMMMVESITSTLMHVSDIRKRDLTEIYQNINKTIYDNIQNRLTKKSVRGNQYENMYMTFHMFRFDDHGNFEVFGNDHAEPLIIRAEDGSIEVIESTGFMLGLMEDAVIGNVPYKFKLNNGDLLVLYSDGISEARDESKLLPNILETKDDDYLFGAERIKNIAKKNAKKTPEEIIQSVIHAVDNWMTSQIDDITMVVIKKT